MYAVANLEKLVIVRARKNDNELLYKESIAIVASTRVIVYVNPIGGKQNLRLHLKWQLYRNH
ncbi:MAG: hypothetical protein QXF08_03445 [Nitrososphaerota archaeon]